MSKLSSIEKRYCRCIMHVSKGYPRYEPYAVCSSSVYTKALGIHRKNVVHCAPFYTYEDYPMEELRGYARLKKIPTGGSRSQLIRSLYDHAKKKINKSSDKRRKMWPAYLREYKRDHPRLTHAEAVTKASKEYKRAKG